MNNGAIRKEKKTMQHLKIYTAQMTEAISMRDEHIYNMKEH